MSEPHKWAWVIRGSLGILAHPKPIWRAWWCLLQKPRQPQVRVRRCHPGALQGCGHKSKCICNIHQYPIGSMYAIYGNIYHQYTPNVSIYTIHGSYGYTICLSILVLVYFLVWMIRMIKARFHLQACKGPEVGWNHWTETLDPSAAAHSSLYLSFREKEFWCLTALLIPGGATLLRGASSDFHSTVLKMTGPRRRRCVFFNGFDSTSVDCLLTESLVYF